MIEDILTTEEKRRLANRKAVAKWRANNKHKTKAWRDANRHKINEAGTRWRQTNPEKYLEMVRKRRDKNREISRKAALDWARNNPGHKAHLNRLRAAAKSGATPSWLSKAHKMEIKRKYDEARYLTVKTGIVHHVDHIHPLNGKTSCGLHVPWNLQVITADENLRKGNKLPCLVNP